jgi:hypothetical protein
MKSLGRANRLPGEDFPRAQVKRGLGATFLIDLTIPVDDGVKIEVLTGRIPAVVAKSPSESRIP